jgi:hypothetical protein
VLVQQQSLANADMTTDWRLARSQACINGGYIYKAENGSTIEIDALLLPNMGGGSASSSFSSVVDAAQYPAITIPVGMFLLDYSAAVATANYVNSCRRVQSSDRTGYLGHSILGV